MCLPGRHIRAHGVRSSPPPGEPPTPRRSGCGTALPYNPVYGNSVVNEPIPRSSTKPKHHWRASRLNYPVILSHISPASQLQLSCPPASGVGGIATNAIGELAAFRRCPWPIGDSLFRPKRDRIQATSAWSRDRTIRPPGDYRSANSPRWSWQTHEGREGRPGRSDSSGRRSAAP